MKRFLSTKTTLEPYGLVTISGEVSRNPFYGTEDPQFEPPFYVQHMTVIDSDKETIQGWTMQGQKKVYVCTLEQREVEKCAEVLIEKFIDDEKSALDYMVDEAIERGKEYKHLAYA